MNNVESAICEEIGLSRSVIKQTGINVSIINPEANTVLFRPGDSCKTFLILCKGSVRVDMTAKSGREVTLYRINPSEGCILTTSALLNKELYYTQGVAESTISAIALTAEDFYKITQYSHEFTKFVLSNYSKIITSIIQLVDRKATRNTMNDVCEYLLLNKNEQNIVKATQNEIANEIGTAREVIGRKLKVLAEQEVIIIQRGSILVKDVNALQKLTLCD